MASNTEQLKIDLKLETGPAAQAVRQYTKAFESDFKALETFNKKNNKKIIGSYKDLWKARDDAGKLENTLQKRQKAHTDKTIQALQALRVAQSNLRKATATGNKDTIDDYRNQVDSLQEIAAAYKKAGDAAKDAAEKQRGEIKSLLDDEKALLERDFTIDVILKNETARAAAVGIGEGISESFSAFAQKDMVSLGGTLAKWTSKGLLASLKKGGGALAEKGKAMQEKGAAMAAAGDGGGFRQMLGGLLKSLGPVMNTIGRLGPIMNMVGSSVMALAKLFLDAEAGAKEFNKSVLSTASTMEFLGKNSGNVDAAAEDLSETLKGVRDAAFDLSNADWGLNKEDYATTMNNLTSQGYALAQLKKDAETSKKSVRDVTLETVHLAAAYSRNMGVSIQEMSQLQGELMGQLGMDLDQVRKAFGSMSREATEAGVNSTQFFNIIRAMSADMSLFNNRMDSAAKILGRVMKVMDPRRAQQFMQGLSGFMKGQSLMDRTKNAIIGGAGSKKNAQESLDRKMKGISASLAPKGVDEKSLRAAVAGGIANLGKYFADLKKSGVEISDAEREAIIDAADLQASVAKGTPIEIGHAMESFDEIDTLKQIDLMAMKMTGKTADQLSDIDRVAAESALNIPEALQKGLGKLRVSLDMNREEIAQRIADQGKPLTKEDEQLLAELGIKATDRAAAADALRQKDSKLVFEKMDADQQKALTESKKQETLAEKTAREQTSFYQKFDVLMDWFMNTFYNVMMGVWDTVVSIYDTFKVGSGDSKRLKRMQVEAARGGTKTSGIASAIANATSPEDAKNKLFQSKTGQAQEKAILDQPRLVKELNDKLGDLQKKKDAATDPKEKAKIEAEQKKTQKELEGVTGKYNAAFKAIENQLGGQDSDASLAASRFQSAAGMAGLDAATLAKVKEASGARTNDGKFDLQSAMMKAGLSEGDQAKVLEKLRLTLSPQQLASAMGDMAKDPAFAESVGQGVDDSKFGQEGLKKGSIYTHDIHTEPLLQGILDTLSGGKSTGVSTSGMSSEDVLDAQEASSASLADIYNVLKFKGIRINQTHLENDIKKVITDGTLESTRQALFEYKLYKDMSNDSIAKFMKDKGVTGGAAAAKGLGEKTLTDMGIGQATATGGSILGMNPDGTAKILRPPPGEAPAFVGAGETVIPKGGGGGGSTQVNVNLALTGDLKRFIQVTAQETMVQNMKMAKFR